MTPAPGSPLAGFGSTPRRVFDLKTIPLHLEAAAGECVNRDPHNASMLFQPAQGTLDPIMARARVVSNGTHKLAILKLDAIGFTRELHDDLSQLAQSLGIPNETFIACATHTHSGPGSLSRKKIWQILASDCFNQQAYDAVFAAAAQALREADAALRPAVLGIGTTEEVDASQNRRGRPGVFDPEMGIVKITDAVSGATIAAVMNFAIHGTVHGADNMSFSADVMGVAEREIERQLGGVALFTNGAEGDVSPKHGLASGTQLAQDLVTAWPSIATKSWVEIGGAFDDLQLPRPEYNVGCPEVPFANESACKLIPGFSLQVPLDKQWLPERAPFQAVRLDRTVFAAVPGEPITEIGWEIKRRGLAKGFEHAFVVGLSGDHLGYITTRDEYHRGLYEGTATLYGPGTGEFAIDAADAVMERVKP